MVTAGSASGICDGAAAVLMASEEAVAKHNLTPLARIVGYGVSGCEGTIMGIGPVPSIRSMCEKTGVSLGQVDQVRHETRTTTWRLQAASPQPVTLDRGHLTLVRGSVSLLSGLSP